MLSSNDIDEVMESTCEWPVEELLMSYEPCREKIRESLLSGVLLLLLGFCTGDCFVRRWPRMEEPKTENTPNGPLEDGSPSVPSQPALSRSDNCSSMTQSGKDHIVCAEICQQAGPLIGYSVTRRLGQRKMSTIRSRHLACLFIADGNVDASASVIQYNSTS